MFLFLPVMRLQKLGRDGTVVPSDMTASGSELSKVTFPAVRLPPKELPNEPPTEGSLCAEAVAAQTSTAMVDSSDLIFMVIWGLSH